MIDLEGLYLFVKVVEEGSFSAASRRLEVPTATVSRRIAQLEEKLGYKLLHRSSRRLTLTESGERYFNACQPLLNGMDEVTTELASELARPSGVLRIASPVNLANNLLAPWFFSFMKEYPEIDLKVTLSNHPIDLVDASIDVAFRLGDIQLNDWICRQIGHAQFMLCAAPEYLEHNGEPESPKELAQHALIRTEPIREWQLVSDVGDAYSIQSSGHFVVDELNMAHKAVLAGIGIANLPFHVIHDDLERGALQPVMRGWTEKTRSFHMLYPDRRHIPAKVRAFVDFICARAEESRAN